jgi:hypothetical protein
MSSQCLATHTHGGGGDRSTRTKALLVATIPPRTSKLAHWVRPEEAEEASSFCETTVVATISIATGCCPVHKEEGGRRE